MSLISSSALVDSSIAILSVLLLLWFYFKAKYEYWKKRGTPFVKPLFPFGSFKDNLIGGTSVVDIYGKIYNELKGNKFGGYFEMTVPKLMVIDPSLAYRMLVKDFAHFHDRGLISVNEEHDPLTNNITNLTGHKWRQLRYKLSPVFSTGKLKGMLDQIFNCGGDLLKELDKYADSSKPIEAKEVSSIFTSNVIASCAFGLQFKINSPEGKPFIEMVKKSFPSSKITSISWMLQSSYSAFSKAIGLRGFSKEVTKYFMNLSKETVKYRKQNEIKRNDFLQHLLDMKEKEENDLNEADEHEEEETDEDVMINQLKSSNLYDTSLKESKVMTEDCLAASSFMFLVAGTEVSNALSILLYHLAVNPEVQTRLHDEVQEVIARHGGYSYPAVKDMQYLDQVIQESFRLMPIAGFLTRVCTIPYQIPDSTMVIEKGTNVVIPILSIQRDPQHYPNPELFVPERFAGNNFKPSPTYLPFGDGPRICIAMRFAILEMKVCVARMMSEYSIDLSNKTLHPLQWDPQFMFPRPKGGVWITVKKRTEKL